MNLMLVVSVMSLAVQATAARRISAEPARRGADRADHPRVTYKSALVLGLVLLALTPVINLVLRLESLASAAVVGADRRAADDHGRTGRRAPGRAPLAPARPGSTSPPAYPVCCSARRWWSGTRASSPRSLGVAPRRARRRSSSATSRCGARAASTSAAKSSHIPSILREVARSSQALLAFFALSNVDVIVARNVLDGHDAGLYAAGLIMTKAVLFLPQFVVVVTFPAMSTPRERSRALVRGMLMVAGIGVVAIAGAYLLSGLAMIFVGGEEYAEIESRLWLFAVLGTLLAMLQLLVYAVLARQGRRSVYAPWAALVLVVVLGLNCDSLGSLLAVVVGVDAAAARRAGGHQPLSREETRSGS